MRKDCASVILCLSLLLCSGWCSFWAHTVCFWFLVAPIRVIECICVNGAHEWRIQPWLPSECVNGQNEPSCCGKKAREWRGDEWSVSPWTDKSESGPLSSGFLLPVLWGFLFILCSIMLLFVLVALDFSWLFCFCPVCSWYSWCYLYSLLLGFILLMPSSLLVFSGLYAWSSRFLDAKADF